MNRELIALIWIITDLIIIIEYIAYRIRLSQIENWLGG